MSRLRKLIVALAALTMLVGPIVTDFSPADASHSGVYVRNYRGSTVAMRYAPTSLTNVKVWIPNGTAFQMICWVDHQNFTGNYTSRRWFYGQEYSRGSYGYVHSSYVFRQIRVPHC